jgi:hypothetical protein
MQPAIRRAIRRGLVAVVAIAAAAVTSCDSSPRLEPPVALTAPYESRQLWAVTPFDNESGVSIVDPYRVADLFTMQVEQAAGIETIPVNRVIAAMRTLDLPAVESTADALSLMNALGVDGLITGTITAWDPYPPPTIGAAVQLFHRPAGFGQADVDPGAISRSPTDDADQSAPHRSQPVAVASGMFDARNHDTLAWLKAFAAGRTPLDSAYGADLHLVSMELYTQFVSHRLLHDLLASEQARLQPLAQVNTER